MVKISRRKHVTYQGVVKNNPRKHIQMSLKEAEDILGNRATWELRNMKKALTMMGGWFNTPEDNLRLQAVKVVLKDRKGKR